MKNKQPAQPSYFFHGGFVDLGRAISGSFKRCGRIISMSAEGIGEHFSEIVDKWGDGPIAGIFLAVPNYFMFSFYLMRLVFSSIITPIVTLFVTILQIVVLSIVFLIASIFFGFIIFFDWIFRFFKSISNHCPSCQSKFKIPAYVCSQCGAEHDRLYPGYYGILARKCECGAKLPTSFLNGRQKLEAHCPQCKCNIKDGGLHASWCIPVVGGPSSGKTCYINMTMMSLEKNAKSKYNLEFGHERNGLDEYEENSAILSRGYLPSKTQELRLRYYQFALTPPKATKQQISLCDVAGELFDVNVGGNAINEQTGFRYVNTVMLLIDPLSISDYRSEVAKTINLSGYNSSQQRIDEMLDAFVRTLQNMFSVDAKAMLNTDVAVVFTKADIPGLDEKIGESAVYKHSPSLKSKVKYETQNRLCEQFLREYGEENFLNNLKSRFKSIQFFTCSALGHVANGQPFESSNVEEPFLWLIRKTSKVIDGALPS